MGVVASSAGSVVAVSRDDEHRFSKRVVDAITLRANLGVVGDAHAGITVQHLSRVRADPSHPNLRQVHLMHEELFVEMREFGFELAPGVLGENVTTRGVDLLNLSRDTVLRIGSEARVRITGLRNPCAQIDKFRPGLLARLALKTPTGIVRKAGVMAVVETGGTIEPGDSIAIEPPRGPQIPLERV